MQQREISNEISARLRERLAEKRAQQNGIHESEDGSVSPDSR